ncbi:MAG TPA: hypothetical protein VET85_16570 [Stellaceae bacterium]|nr:hypothetical protein [Stellaceae bacterium]
MAKRAGGTKPTTKGGNSSAGDAEERLIEAALALAVAKGWRGISLGEIVEAAGLPLASAYRLHLSKVGILDGLRRRTDRAVLAGPVPDAGTPPRDRLFDVLMRRFDALQPHQVALRAILRDAFGDPASMLAVPKILASMAWMLEAAGISTAGWSGKLRVNVLAGVYLSVFRVFLDDESSDLTATMAALDRRLRGAESLLRLSRFGPKEPSKVSN